MLGFLRYPGRSFKPAVATPIHWGRRVPGPRLVNDTEHVDQVLSEALLVPKDGRTIEELGANWFS
ncbi:hypothetical protein ACWEQG_17875 [Microbispora sp. NPDC004025]